MTREDFKVTIRGPETTRRDFSAATGSTFPRGQRIPRPGMARWIGSPEKYKGNRLMYLETYGDSKLRDMGGRQITTYRDYSRDFRRTNAGSRPS
jgi:hypothetical protein